MGDISSIAVFCSESIECVPGIPPKFFFKLLVTVPVAPIISGIILHFFIIIIVVIIVWNLKTFGEPKQVRHLVQKTAHFVQLELITSDFILIISTFVTCIFIICITN
jgi:hypothetical protein